MPIERRLSRRKSRRPLFHRIIFLLLGMLLIGAVIIAITLFQYILRPNVNTGEKQQVSVFIHTGADYRDVRQILYSNDFIIHQKSFEWLAGRKNYPANIKPGHYLIRQGMNNNELVNLLRSGAQTPVRVIFNNIRLLEDLAGRISDQIEADSVSLMMCWRDERFLDSLGISPNRISAIFIPNTYEMWWNSDAYQFTRRMYREYESFWQHERGGKAVTIGLDRHEVIILASIVEKETQKNDEKPVIAGVYLNRLRKNWPLQADPTLVYASGDFELKRVLDKHKEIDSPYNTYKHNGLPPGPICIPSISSIDAVLDAGRHDYMFFCAKDDLSGYHVFSKTLSQHNRYARAYQKALNRNRIR